MLSPRDRARYISETVGRIPLLAETHFTLLTQVMEDEFDLRMTARRRDTGLATIEAGLSGIYASLGLQRSPLSGEEKLDIAACAYRLHQRDFQGERYFKKGYSQAKA
ncbi:MAG TPA: hypothetical protein VHO23_00215 [Candidatus Paceibacterota bacterium]|nr:hypothetical protein [Candidatus Paceibacterota bacterium]